MNKSIKIISWAYLAIYEALLVLIISIEFSVGVNYSGLAHIIGLAIIPPVAMILHLRKQPVPIAVVVFGIYLLVSTLSEAHMFSDFVMVAMYSWFAPMLLFLAFIGVKRAIK
jgi:hypothetical protein